MAPRSPRGRRPWRTPSAATSSRSRRPPRSRPSPPSYPTGRPRRRRTPPPRPGAGPRWPPPCRRAERARAGQGAAPPGRGSPSAASALREPRGGSAPPVPRRGLAGRGRRRLRCPRAPPGAASPREGRGGPSPGGSLPRAPSAVRSARGSGSSWVRGCRRSPRGPGAEAGAAPAGTAGAPSVHLPPGAARRPPSRRAAQASARLAPSGLVPFALPVVGPAPGSSPRLAAAPSSLLPPGSPLGLSVYPGALRGGLPAEPRCPQRTAGARLSQPSAESRVEKKRGILHFSGRDAVAPCTCRRGFVLWKAADHNSRALIHR